MKKTEHYQLNQWELSDRIMVEDFNKDNETIDGALAGKAPLNEFLSFQQSAAADLAALQQSTATNLAALQQSTSAELAALRQSASADLEALRQSMSAELATLRQNTTAELATLTAGLAAAGNCKIVTGSYVGNGTYGSANKNIIHYDQKPLFIMMNVGVYNANNNIPKVFIFFRDVVSATSNSDNTPLSLTWAANSVSWYFGGSNSNGFAASNQFNASGTTYNYIMFFA